MLRVAVLEGKKIEYEDKKFKLEYNECLEDFCLTYIGKGIGIKNTKENIYNVFGFKENQVTILKVEKEKANICVKGVVNKRNTINFYLVKQKI